LLSSTVEIITRLVGGSEAPMASNIESEESYDDFCVTITNSENIPPMFKDRLQR